MDKLALEEAGFSNAVSVPNGAPDKVKNGPLPETAADKAFQYVWNCWTELEQASCILLGTDNDLPGHALAEELARRLGRCRLLHVYHDLYACSPVTAYACCFCLRILVMSCCPILSVIAHVQGA